MFIAIAITAVDSLVGRLLADCGWRSGCKWSVRTFRYIQLSIRTFWWMATTNSGRDCGWRTALDFASKGGLLAEGLSVGGVPAFWQKLRVGVNAPIAGCERDYGWRFKLDAGFAGSGREKLQVVTLW